MPWKGARGGKTGGGGGLAIDRLEGGYALDGNDGGSCPLDGFGPMASSSPSALKMKQRENQRQGWSLMFLCYFTITKLSLRRTPL